MQTNQWQVNKNTTKGLKTEDRKLSNKTRLYFLQFVWSFQLNMINWPVGKLSTLSELKLSNYKC